MYIQIINVQLEGIGAEDYAGLCDQLAPGVGAQSGLVSKVWLADPATNTYGGVYHFADQAALEAYLASSVVQGMRQNPHFVDVTARAFATIEEATSVTAGALAGVAAGSGGR